jgi:ribosomal protein S18 acetylase RimI-like enzyme
MDDVVVIREVSTGDWETMRDVRLAALREAPQAFGSTYTREAAFTREQWIARIASLSVTYLAYLAEDAGHDTTGHDTAPAGIAGVYEADGTADLVSMWVSPSARGRKAGEALVIACADWARARGHAEIFLWVTESNAAARRLYERCGFIPTGERQPRPSDPSLPEIRMRRAL